MNHYARLFRYKAKPERSPLEDFLTEALADLLARMPLDEVVALFDHALRDDTRFRFGEFLKPDDLRWETQVAVPGGIADLVLWVGAKPVLVIENKTWSGFQDHSTDEEEANQVTTYCRWLAREAAEPDRCAVLLLTGTTFAPNGFHDVDGPYAIARRGQLTWAALGRWLRSKTTGGDNDGEQQEIWRVLARELVEFLKETKLSSEIYTPTDVSAAHLFVPSMQRWQSTFESIWSGSETTWSQFLNKKLSAIHVSTEGGLVWQWRYVADGVAPIRSYVGLGVRFPDQSEWYHGMGLPEMAHFFLLVSTDNGYLARAGALPDGWVYNEDEGEFLTSLALADLDHAVDKRIDQLRGWAVPRLGEAESILRSCTAG